uniref:Putative secreted protein n=1 Tax=Ixodes scapularis TaxID=6945 RepID=Q8MVE8_IXOSC|nr:putative secreted protein [Ixodes scapularis]
MKDSIAVLCFLVALSYVLATLTEDECRAQLAFSSCEANSTRVFYSFFNNTNQCESYTGCDTGKNRFPSLGKCINECPYGNHHPPGMRVRGTY